MASVTRPAVLACVLLVAFSASCGKPAEVQRYKAPKDPMWRMLGAIVPAKGDTWFFKLVGPSTRLPAYKDEFVAFVKSLKVAEGVTWTLPSGWSEQKGQGDRKSTLRFGREEPLLEVSITSFPGDAGGLQPNLNRWRGQLGLPPGGDASGTLTLDVSGVKVTLADFEGPKQPSMGPPPMAAARPPEESQRKPELRSMFVYDVPAGWTENQAPQGDRILEFRNGEVLVTLTAFAGPMGDVAMNVNRWRGQVGLSPLSAEEAARSCRPEVLLNREALYVELLGTAKGIICAFVLDRGGSLFLKMDGPPAEVDRQKPSFHALMKSLKVDRNG